VKDSLQHNEIFSRGSFDFDKQRSTHNMSGPELRRDLTPNLSSPSQHYTFDESEDGDINNSVADSSTQSQNMNGATSTSISKSARYQTALTARARQRQMRRMLEREGSGGESPGSAGDVALTPREGEYRGRGRNEISPSTPGSAATPTSELMRLRALLNSNRSSNSENSDHTSPDSQMLATLYEKHRGRSLSRTREAPSLPTSPLEDCSNGGGGLRHMTRSPSSPNLGASELPKLISPPTNNPSVVTPQQSECDNRNSGGIDNGVVVRSIDDRVTTFSKQQHQQQQQQNQFRASPTTIPPSASSLRQQRILSITPNEEFLPDWNATKGGGLLSTTEVQDAANFTSIQFQLSITSGEVEMLSGDDASCQNNQCWQNEVWSDVSPPSPLASGEIFHKAAAASIVSLLSPNRMAKAGLMAPEVNSSEEDDAAKDVAGDSPTGVIISPGNDGQSGSVDVKELFTFNGNSDPSLSRGGEWEGVTQVTRSLFRGDVDEDVRQSMVFQAFRGKMIDSSPEFSQLLSQINRKRGTSIDRAFAIRRKNACGALKILSAKEENRIKICWTVGVLPAIASVLSDVSEVIPDEISRAANTEARNRIVSTLLNMSVNKKNRMLIVNTPGILESISQTILHDAGEGRQGCCAVLLYLAKTSEARGMIVKSAGMMDALAKVIEVPKVHPKSTPKSKMRKQHLANIYESPSKESGFSSRSSHSSVSSQSGSRSSNSASGSEDGDDSVGSVESTIAPGEVEQMEISFETADTTVPTSPKSVAEDMYDADPNRFLHGARLSVFACLLCLVKSQENSVRCST
jgi:hypothetical protein